MGKTELCSWMKYRQLPTNISLSQHKVQLWLYTYRSVAGFWVQQKKNGLSIEQCPQQGLTLKQGFSTLFCPKMRNGHELGIPLCWGSWESAAPRDGTSSLQATSQTHGVGKESAANGEHGLDDSITSTKEKHWMRHNEWVLTSSICPSAVYMSHPCGCFFIPGEGLGSPRKHRVLLGWPKPSLQGSVTSETGLRRSSQPTAARDTHGRSR